MEKTNTNVALGFLSVLLGYVCLHGPCRTLFEENNPGNGIDCLVASIQQFTDVHRRTGDSRPDTEELAGKLQDLIDELHAGF